MEAGRRTGHTRALNKEKTKFSVDAGGMDSCTACTTYLPKLLVHTEVVHHHYPIQDFQEGVLSDGLVWLFWGSAQ